MYNEWNGSRLIYLKTGMLRKIVHLTRDWVFHSCRITIINQRRKHVNESRHGVSIFYFNPDVILHLTYILKAILLLSYTLLLHFFRSFWEIVVNALPERFTSCYQAAWNTRKNVVMSFNIHLFSLPPSFPLQYRSAVESKFITAKRPWL